MNTVAKKVLDTLAQSDFPYRQLIEMMPAALMILADDEAIFVNAAARELLEADPQDELLGLPVTAFVHPLDHKVVEERMCQLRVGASLNPPMDLRIITRRGQLRRVLSSSMRVVVGETPLIVVLVTDDTKRHESEDRLRENEDNFQRLFESTQDVYYRTDANGVVLKVAPAVRRVLGYEPEEIVGRLTEDYYPHPSERDALKAALKAHGHVQDFEGRMVRRDGVIIDISISSYVLYSPEGEFLGVEGIYRDVSDRKNLERELRRLATTDMLTGIANRRAFLERATESLRHARRYDKGLVLFIVDLDHFKSINDRSGHLAGDAVLKRVVETISPELRETDLFGRLGGEEFGILLHEAHRQEADRVANRLGECVRNLRFLDEGGDEYGVTISIGATELHHDDRGIERLLVRADMALYAAKEAGRDQTQWSPF